MKFGWINLAGALLVILILIPNIQYAVKAKNRQIPKTRPPKALVICEQIGRYACMVLMWLPLLVWEFGFSPSALLTVYALGNFALLIAYYVVWVVYTKKPTLPTAMTLAILPTAIFLLSGVTLRHPLLIVAAVIFGISHCLITYKTH